MSEKTALWRYIEERLDGRSWNWLGTQLGITGAGVRSWAAGRTRIKGYQADAIAAVLDVHPDEIRRRADLPLKRLLSRAELLDQLRRESLRHNGFDGYSDEQLAVLLDAYYRADGTA